MHGAALMHFLPRGAVLRIQGRRDTQCAADLNRRDPSFRTCFRAFTRISFSLERKLSQAKRDSPTRCPSPEMEIKPRQAQLGGLAFAPPLSFFQVIRETARS